MAYNSSSYGNRGNQGARTPAATPAAGKSEFNKDDVIQIGGVFVYTNKETGQKSDVLLYTGKVKEDIMIPAGSTLKVFKKGGLSKNGKNLPELDIVAQKKAVRSGSRA